MSNRFERLCKCPAWAPNAEKINGILHLQQIRTGQGYDGERFKFCPWCGSELLFVPLEVADVLFKPSALETGEALFRVPGTNTGHGYVWPRPDGMKHRCGGPALCEQCALDRAESNRARSTDQSRDANGSTVVEMRCFLCGHGPNHEEHGPLGHPWRAGPVVTEAERAAHDLNRSEK